ncbi:MAG: phenylacetate--CoA ligase family protein [Armatimonadota bacterium]
MSKEFYDQELESMPKRVLVGMQLERLQDVVKRAYSSSRFYRALYDEGGVVPSDIRSLDDIQNLPFLDADALRDAYPNGLAVSPRRHFREISGRHRAESPPAVVFYTRKDLRLRAQLHARILTMAGLHEGDVVLNLAPCGIGDPGLGINAGAHLAGMIAVPGNWCGAGELFRMASELGVAGVCARPADLLLLTKQCSQVGWEHDRTPRLKVVMACGGAWPDGNRDEARDALEAAFGTPVLDAVAMTQPLLEGLGGECHCRDGLHVWADAFLVECVHPDTGDWVEEGEIGELVWTWLAGDGSALIRYRSGDLATVTWEGKCACGRTHPKVSPPLGRADESFTVAGRLVLAVQLEKSLRRISDLTGEYHVVVERPRTIDRVTLQVEVRDALLLQDKERSRRVRMQVADAAKAVIGIRAQIELLPPASLPAVSDRAQRIEDRRRAA